MKVLLGYDGSTYADAAIDDLQWAGLPETTDAVVLSAVEWPAMLAVRNWGMVQTDFSPEWMKRIEHAQQLADTGAARVRKLFPKWNIDIEPSGGDPADSILEKARTWPADLILVGTHGRGAVGRAVLGSVSMKVVRHAPCPVRVARTRKHDGPVRLLIGVDGSGEANAAVDEVCRRSWPKGTEVCVFAAQELFELAGAERIGIGERIHNRVNQDELLRMKNTAGESSEKLQAAGLNASPVVMEGDPKVALAREAHARNVDTIFVGARGLSRVEGLFLGSVSSATVAHALCTVEVVRRHGLT
jgi:nucleotide-binding universal stress UspA family protein